MKIVQKPWGSEFWFAHTKKYVGKILIIKKGCRLSKQYHNFKHETLYTDKGRYVLEIKGRNRIINKGQSVVIPPKTVHRIHAKFSNIKLIEVSTPQVWDVVRIEDDYGRKKTPK